MGTTNRPSGTERTVHDVGHVSSSISTDPAAGLPGEVRR
jgi:hypothetical protein